MADYTDITILLDASGSMAATQKATVEGLISFIKDQQGVPGEATLTIIEFHDPTHYKRLAKSVPIRSFDPTKLIYRPIGGSTALRNAWYKAMKERGAEFASMSEGSRPDKVVFVVITDGQDNASYETPRAHLMNAVRHQTEVYKWQFIYLGANQDAVTEGASYGVAPQYAMTYDVNYTTAATAPVSSTVASYRETGVLRSFTKQERDAAMGKTEDEAK